ncbi:MAG TPA: hypothetical protein VF768_05590, partial [Holophagaceae bacterium]
MLPPTPPPVVHPAPAPPLDAEIHLLDAYDWGRPLPEAPGLKGPDALRYRWLKSAATLPPGHLPPDP